MREEAHGCPDSPAGWVTAVPLFSPLQRPSLVTVVEWIDYETLALLFGMVRLCFGKLLPDLLKERTVKSGMLPVA